MKLPSAGKAIIEVGKLCDYLLSFTHPVGRFKAAFFANFGYTQDNWRRLEEDIRALISFHEAKQGQQSPYGRKYEVRGMITGPNGKSFAAVTVWIVLKGEDVPRFVTAYPEERP